MNYVPYWIVERKLKSGGTVLVGLGNDGPIYCEHDFEMRFGNQRSAADFRDFAERHLSIRVGQEGMLFNTLVKPHS